MNDSQLTGLGPMDEARRTIQKLETTIEDLKRELKRLKQVKLGHNTVFRGLKLTAQESKCLGALLVASPKPVSNAEMIDAIWWSCWPPESADVSVRMLMMRLRRKLQTAGMTIETQRGVGWSVTEETARQLRSMVI